MAPISRSGVSCFLVRAVVCLLAVSFPALTLLLAVGPLPSVQAKGVGTWAWGSSYSQRVVSNALVLAPCGRLRVTWGLVFYPFALHSTLLVTSPHFSILLYSALLYSTLGTLQSTHPSLHCLHSTIHSIPTLLLSTHSVHSPLQLLIRLLWLVGFVLMKQVGA